MNNSEIFSTTKKKSRSFGIESIIERIFFAAEDNDGSLHSFYVKSVKEMPYYISVLQISAADSEAPTAAPSAIDPISIMSKQGCKAFTDLLRGSKALPSFKENVDGGLTVFCPTHSTVSGFAAKYKNLTEAQKVSLLLYHTTPVYESLHMLKSSNEIMNILAIEGANKYDFTVQSEGEDVNLKTKVNTTVYMTLKLSIIIQCANTYIETNLQK
uniref:FAS1 domain-containing protein n=1 Tax=Glycine max TaxID=3847 RepID=I1JHU1_SOYBN